MKPILLITTLFQFAPFAQSAAIWSAQLLPESGEIAAPQGGTAGWGYSITNEDSSLWLLPFNLDADTFEQGTPSSLFLFPLIAPGATITVPYDGIDGLYGFSWDLSVPLGFQNVGIFMISADWFTGDPALGGAFSLSAGTVELPYSITAAGPNAIPEPGTFLVGAAALAVTACLRGKR